MPNTAQYNREYYQANNPAIQKQKQSRRACHRHDPVFLARVTWLRALMQRHGLTHTTLGAILDLYPHTITTWLLRPTARHWEPISQVWEEQIRRLIPETAPMDPALLEMLAHLPGKHARWSAVRRKAYLAYCGQETSITREDLLTWRRAVGLTRQEVARLLELSAASLMHWEAGRAAIPPVHQQSIRWLIEHYTPPQKES